MAEKTALLPEILPRLPKKFGTYYEPFIGGGAVFFALAAEKRFERAVISDANKELIRTYEALKRDVDNVIRALKKHVYEEKHYNAVRAQNPNTLGLASHAARFIYLNRSCFNGLYRVNRKGEFNVPFGRYKNPTICDEENLRAVSLALQSVTLETGDFEEATHSANKGDVVYHDPPYLPVSKTSNFVGYTKGGFGPDQQERLRNVMEKLDARGVHVLLSNIDAPLVRDLYEGFKIEEVQAPRRVNSKGGKRGNVGELLISGRN